MICIGKSAKQIWPEILWSYKNTIFFFFKLEKLHYFDNSWATITLLEKWRQVSIVSIWRLHIQTLLVTHTAMQSVSQYCSAMKGNTLTWCALGVSVLGHRSKLRTKVMLMRHWWSFPWQTLGGLEAAWVWREEAGVGGRCWSAPETNVMICQSHATDILPHRNSQTHCECYTYLIRCYWPSRVQK